MYLSELIGGSRLASVNRIEYLALAMSGKQSAAAVYPRAEEVAL